MTDEQLRVELRTIRALNRMMVLSRARLERGLLDDDTGSVGAALYVAPRDRHCGGGVGDPRLGDHRLGGEGEAVTDD